MMRGRRGKVDGMIEDGMMVDFIVWRWHGLSLAL